MRGVPSRAVEINCVIDAVNPPAIAIFDLAKRSKRGKKSLMRKVRKAKNCYKE